MSWLQAIAVYAEEAYAAAAEYASSAYSAVAESGAAASTMDAAKAAAAESGSSVWSEMASSIIQSLAMQAASSALGGTKSFGISERVAISPLEPRHIIFGKAWTAGRKMSKELTWDASCKKAEFLIAIADTQTTGIQSFTAYGNTYNGIFVDGYPVSYLSSDDYHGHEIYKSFNPETGEKVKQFTAGGPWKFFYKYHDGSPSQVADQWLVEGIGAADSSRWDAAAVAKGISYVRASAYFDSNIFTGFPEFNFYVNGVPLYNPAKDSTVGGSGLHRWGVPSTYESSSNPAVIAYNIARGIYVDGVFFYGCKYLAEDLPLDFWLAAISACDEVITDKAGTSPRYSCGFDWDVTRDAREALQVCARAMGGRIVEERGQYLAFAGVAQVPIFSFTDDDMVRGGDHHYDPKLDLDNLRNRVTAKCLDVSQAFAQVDVAARYSDDDIAADGGFELTDDIDLMHVQHVPTAQRVMKVSYQRHRCQATAVRTFKPHAMNARTGQWVAGTSRRWTGTKWFEIVTSDVDTETLYVAMSLREVPYNLGAWNSATDELDKASVSYPAAPDVDPLEVTGINPTQLSDLGGDGSVSPGIAVGYIEIDDPTARQVALQIGQIIASGFDGISNSTTTFSDSTASAFTGSMVGKIIAIDDAGASGGQYTGIIDTYISATDIALDVATNTSATGCGWMVIGDTRCIYDDDPTSGIIKAGNLLGNTPYAFRTKVIAIQGRESVWSDWHTVTTTNSTLPSGSVGTEQLNSYLASAKAAVELAQSLFDERQNAADAYLAQANIVLADAVQNAAQRGTKTETRLTAEFTKGINRSSASITEQLVVLADKNEALASRTQTVEVQLFGFDDGEGVVYAAVEDAAIAYVTPLGGVASRTTTIEAQLSGLDDDEGSVMAAIEDAATAYVTPLGTLASTVIGLSAIFGGVSSSSIFKAGAVATSAGAAATFAFTATATDGTHTATGGWSIDAVVSGAITKSVMRLYADELLITASKTLFEANDGTSFAAFDGATKSLIIDRIESGAITNSVTYTTGDIVHQLYYYEIDGATTPEGSTLFTAHAGKKVALGITSVINDQINFPRNAVAAQDASLVLTYMSTTSSRHIVRAGIEVYNGSTWGILMDTVVGSTTASLYDVGSLSIDLSISSAYTKYRPCIWPGTDDIHVYSLQVKDKNSTK